MALLTIDDVPSIRFEAKFHWLSQQKIPAILFVWGEKISGYEYLLTAALRGGFILGNHSWTHRNFSALSITEACQEIDRTDSVLAEIYDTAEIAWSPKYFRFPYLDRGRDSDQMQELQAALRDRGYSPLPQMPPPWVDIGINFDQMEYWLGNPEAPDGLNQVQKILARIKPGQPGLQDVILIHDHDYSHELFFECINRYRQLGLKFTLPKG